MNPLPGIGSARCNMQTFFDFDQWNFIPCQSSCTIFMCRILEFISMPLIVGTDSLFFVYGHYCFSFSFVMSGSLDHLKLVMMELTFYGVNFRTLGSFKWFTVLGSWPLRINGMLGCHAGFHLLACSIRSDCELMTFVFLDLWVQESQKYMPCGYIYISCKIFFYWWPFFIIIILHFYL